MDLEQQKLQWQNANNKSPAEWTSRYLETTWRHPALRSLKRQLVFECGCWLLFLAVYYTGLDGDLRPLAWNVALVIGLLLLIGHGMVGYRLASRPIGDAPLKQALLTQMAILRKYSLWSMALRTLTLLIFIGFLSSNVPDLWRAPRIWFMGTVAIWVIAAVIIQYLIWRGHFRRLSETLEELA